MADLAALVSGVLLGPVRCQRGGEAGFKGLSFLRLDLLRRGILLAGHLWRRRQIYEGREKK